MMKVGKIVGRFRMVVEFYSLTCMTNKCVSMRGCQALFIHVKKYDK